jgi:hypothetical protein
MALTQVSRGLLSTSIVDNGNATAITIDSSENVGIGTGSPSEPLTVLSAQDYQITAAYNATNSTSYGYYGIKNNNTGNPFYFNVGGAERMRLDASGNLLVGKTVTSSSTAGMLIGSNGRFDAVRDGGYVGYFNRLSSNGDIALFAKDGTTVGSIGTNSSTAYIAGDASGIRLGSTAFMPSTTAGANKDDAVDLGHSSVRFKDIYATNGTIQTSDRNEKQDIEELSDAEQRVAVACKGLMRKFRWKSAVEEKGDEARIHFGIIAQDLQAAFEAEGLDAGRYAMFTDSTWTDEETGEERSRMGVRYSELLAFIIAAI